jgi:hypothetical protein
MSKIRSTFLSWLIMSNFSSVVIRRFVTWIALGDVDLYLSLILATKAKAVERGTKSAAYHQRNHSTRD